MSYDIRLKDPVTDETLDLPVKHVMTGGTYPADIIDFMHVYREEMEKFGDAIEWLPEEEARLI